MNWTSSFYVIKTDFLVVVFDQFSGPSVVNLTDMVYDVCIVDDFNSELDF